MQDITDLYFLPDSQAVIEMDSRFLRLIESGTSERKLRIQARRMMEEVLILMSDHIDAYMRDDDMNISVRMLDGRWVDAEVLSADLYTLLSTLDIYAEYPLSHSCYGRKSWTTSRFTYKLNNEIFLIERTQ